MKIKYKFVDGTVSEVEVEESIGAFIVEDRRREGNLARKEGYHCYSLDAVEFEGMDFAAEGTPETILAALEEDRRIYEAFRKLSEVQQKRLLMLAGGMSIREIARQEGMNFRTVHESVESGRKNLKSFSEKHPIKTASKSPYSEGHNILPFRNRRWKGEAHIEDQCSKEAGIGRDRGLPPYLHEGASRALPPWGEAAADHHRSGRFRPGTGDQ